MNSVPSSSLHKPSSWCICEWYHSNRTQVLKQLMFCWYMNFVSLHRKIIQALTHSCTFPQPCKLSNTKRMHLYDKAANSNLVPMQLFYNNYNDVIMGVLNHRRPDCLLNRLFKRRSKKASKLRIPGLCEGNSQVTGEIPTQRPVNPKNISISWRHHEFASWFRLQTFNVNLSSFALHICDSIFICAFVDFISRIDILIMSSRIGEWHITSLIINQQW